MSNIEVALEELIENEDAAEKEQRVVDDQRKAKDSQERKCRGGAEEGNGNTWADDDESGGRKKKRSSGRDALNFLREKIPCSDYAKRGIELRTQQLEVKSKKQDNMQIMMLNQQQQQMKDFKAVMAVQAKQHDHSMIAPTSKLVEKK